MSICEVPLPLCIFLVICVKQKEMQKYKITELWEKKVIEQDGRGKTVQDR